MDSQSERVVRYKMALQAFDNWVHAPDKSRAIFGTELYVDHNLECFRSSEEGCYIFLVCKVPGF